MSSTVANVNQERQFISTYAELMNLSKDAPSDIYYSTQDYNKLASLGPSLPKFSYKLPTGLVSSPETVSTTISLKIKSIKPPFKFTTDLQVSSTTSIYKVKDLLIENTDSLKGLKPTEIKLLLKSKVLQDTSVLSLIAGEATELNFNCMVSPQPVSTAATPSATVSNNSDDPVIETPKTVLLHSLSDSAWLKIEQIVQQELGDLTKAKDVVQKFKESL